MEEFDAQFDQPEVQEYIAFGIETAEYYPDYIEGATQHGMIKVEAELRALGVA